MNPCLPIRGGALEEFAKMTEQQADTSPQANPAEQQEAEPGDGKKPVDSITPLSMPDVIDNYIHYARDVRLACRSYVPAAINRTLKEFEDGQKNLEKASALMASENEAEKVHGTKLATKTMRRLQRMKNSKVHEIIESSLFISLFSAFDDFTGKLLTTIYMRSPKLFSAIGERSISFAEILASNSLEAIKNSVLEADIESIRRESYTKQFKSLESRFNVELRRFSNWKKFIEASQRRNLFTHCGGVVTEQYRQVCLEAGWEATELPTIGTKLELGPKYFMEVCEVMIETALKLGQVLWRKLFPEEAKEANEHLHGVQYDSLYVEMWHRAAMIGQFAKQPIMRCTDMQQRLCIINLAIAQKFSGLGDAAARTLAEVDWSASIPEFRMAVEILSDRFQDAADVMRKIGKRGELFTEHNCHTWPLFRDFRQSNEFAKAYEEVFGYPFTEELARQAEGAKSDAAKVDTATGGVADKDAIQEKGAQGDSADGDADASDAETKQNDSDPSRPSATVSK